MENNKHSSRNYNNTVDLLAKFENRNIKQTDTFFGTRLDATSDIRKGSLKAAFMNSKTSNIDSLLIQENKRKINEYHDAMLNCNNKLSYTIPEKPVSIG